MRNFLIWISGVQPDLLEQAPADRAKYQGIGGAVLTTATLAAISMYFALQMAVRAPWWGALFISIVWFGAILNLDRWLVVSIQRTDKRRQALTVALPRLLLALLFGVVISTPLVLQIFRPEVEAEINKIRLEQTEQFQGDLTGGATGKKIKDLETREASLLATISSGGAITDAEADPTVVNLRSQLDSWSDKRDNARRLAACELTGFNCPGGTTGKSGDGPIYRQRLAEQNDAQAEVDKLTRRLDSRIKDLQTSEKTSRSQTLRDANAALPGVQKQLTTLRDLQHSEQTAFEEKNENNTGFLIRLKALDRVSGDDFTLGMWRLLLFLLITTLECLPIFVKILQLFGPRTAYEQIAYEHEQTRLLSGKDSAQKRHEAATIEREAALTQTRALAEARAQAVREISDLTVQAEKRVAAAILAAWEQREIDNIPHKLDQYLTSGTYTEVTPVEQDVEQPAPLFGPGAPGVSPYWAANYDVLQQHNSTTNDSPAN
ncbi:MAG: DUF4407 domain-containing protein [Streptosporangiaceae bacterium]